jgi:DNA invertase Pin-like site-specific DNA recombinase
LRTPQARDEGASGRSLDRPGLRSALERIAAGEASGLVAAKLDRLSRSALDFARLVERSQRAGWTLAVLDIGVDMTTPNGRLVGGVLVQVAQWERELIGERTRAALAEAKAEGVRVGRPASVPPEVVRRIRRRRKAGWSLPRIADRLEEEGVPTGHGGKRWRPSSVASVLGRATR